MIEELLLKKSIDLGFKFIGKKLQKSSKEISINISKNSTDEGIADHMQMVDNWSRNISFCEFTNIKSLNDCFINLDLELIPLNKRLVEKETEKISSSDLLNYHSHIVILGNPGSGKTTSVKYFCQKLLYDNNYSYAFPIVIQFRDLKSDETILNRLEKILRLHIEIKYNSDYIAELKKREKIEIEEEKEKKSGKEIEIVENELRELNEFSIYLKKEMLISIICDLNAIVFLDGLDEVSSEKFTSLIEEFRNLTIKTSKTKYFLTCRTGIFDYNVSNTKIFEIAKLSKEQIKSFVEKWINDKKYSNILYNKIIELPYFDTASRPLTLAHLCAIYEKYKELPEKPKSIYKKIVNLLLEEWDKNRSIKRESKYTDFQSDRKFEFLCHLAYYMTIVYKKTRFTHYQIEEAYKVICKNFNLPESEYNIVATEIESHTGLIIRCTYEEFEFAHKSIQEYLTAEYIIKLPTIPKRITNRNVIPNELALAVCLSSNPTEYFIIMVFDFFMKGSYDESYIYEFLNRLYIEKVDFFVDELLGISFMILISSLIKKNESPELIKYKYFDNLFEITNLKNSLLEIKKYYKLNILINTYTLEWYKKPINDLIYELPKSIMIQERYKHYFE